MVDHWGWRLPAAWHGCLPSSWEVLAALGGAQEILEHAWGQTGIAGEQEW